MATSALLAQLLQSVLLTLHFPPVASPSRQLHKRRLNYQEIQKKDILTLDEAAFFIGTNPEILLEEVSFGHIPGSNAPTISSICKQSPNAKKSLLSGYKSTWN